MELAQAPDSGGVRYMQWCFVLIGGDYNSIERRDQPANAGVREVFGPVPAFDLRAPFWESAASVQPFRPHSLSISSGKQEK